jgi:hypothetical protein
MLKISFRGGLDCKYEDEVLQIILYRDMGRACRLLAMYIQEQMSPGKNSVDSKIVLKFILEIQCRIEKEGQSGKGSVAGLYEHSNDF